MLEEGEILIEEVIEIVSLSAFSNGMNNLMDYIFMEQNAKVAQKNKQIDHIFGLLSREKNPENRKKLSEQLKSLKEN